MLILTSPELLSKPQAHEAHETLAVEPMRHFSVTAGELGVCRR